MRKNQRANNYFIISVGVVLVFLGIVLLSNNYLKGKIEKAYDSINLELLAYNEDVIDDNSNEVLEEVVQENKQEKKEEKKENTNSQVNKINYVAKLRIPKISLERGLVDINSRYNHVDYNIQTLKGSNYPNVKNGNLILLSHSGTSYISFFKNLYKLNVGDKCYIEYKGKTYTYEIKKIYNKPKVGKVTIDRDYSKNTLTLITCTKDSDTEQTIYIGELI